MRGMLKGKKTGHLHEREFRRNHVYAVVQLKKGPWRKLARARVALEVSRGTTSRLRPHKHMNAAVGIRRNEP